MRIGELFAGYGGLGMGVKAALGGDIAWVSDIDKGANKVLANRFPGVPNIGDITTIDWSTVEPIDILTGGSPCQDLSHAGRRAGMTEGTRSNLWVAMREAIAQLRPSLVVWENVRGAYSAAADSAVEVGPGLLGPPDGGPTLRALGRVLGDLSDLGYVGGWHGLRAADVGAPHGRFRVFVVAYAADNGLEIQRLARGVEPRHATAIGAGASTLLPSPRTSDTNGAGLHGDGGMDLRTAVTLLPTPLNADAGPRGGTTGFGLRDWSRAIEAQRLLPTPMVGSTSPAAHGQISGQYREQMAEALANWGQYAEAIARWEAITRPAPAPTEPSAKGNPRLSPRFSEWLMGLPDGWITDVPGVTRNEALKLAGNGVVWQQAEAAIRFLLNVGAVAA